MYDPLQTSLFVLPKGRIPGAEDPVLAAVEAVDHGIKLLDV